MNTVLLTLGDIAAAFALILFWAIAVGIPSLFVVALLLVTISLCRAARDAEDERRYIGPKAGDPLTATQEYTEGPRSWVLDEDDIEFLGRAGVRV